MRGLEELEQTADVEEPPVVAPEDEEPYDEDVLDNWRKSPDARRNLPLPWTGATRCEVQDGTWETFTHGEPRRMLYIPGDPDSCRWTGRRRTSIAYCRGLGNPVPGG